MQYIGILLALAVAIYIGFEEDKKKKIIKDRENF